MLLCVCPLIIVVEHLNNIQIGSPRDKSPNQNQTLMMKYLTCNRTTKDIAENYHWQIDARVSFCGITSKVTEFEYLEIKIHVRKERFHFVTATCLKDNTCNWSGVNVNDSTDFSCLTFLINFVLCLWIESSRECRLFGSLWNMWRLYGFNCDSNSMLLSFYSTENWLVI